MPNLSSPKATSNNRKGSIAISTLSIKHSTHIRNYGRTFQAVGMTQTQGSVSRLVTGPSRSPTCFGAILLSADAYLAAAHRFEAMLKQYPDMDIAGDALY